MKHFDWGSVWMHELHESNKNTIYAGIEVTAQEETDIGTIELESSSAL